LASIIIVGGGVIGLGIGFELLGRGAEVTLIDRGHAGRGTSWLSGGMLAADAEIGFEEPELYALTRRSLDAWPDFAQRIQDASGLPVDYRTDGTFLVADDRDAAEALRRKYEFQRDYGLQVEWLTGAEALEREPFLAPRLAAAVFASGDHQVDNKLLMIALREAFVRLGGRLVEQTPVEAIEGDARRPAVRTTHERYEADTVVVAAGVWSRTIQGLEQAPPLVRPVKGQMLELRAEAPFSLGHVIRGPRAYLVPKSDGRLLIGATSEDMGFDTRVTAGGLYTLLENAWEIVPGIYDLPVTETWAGLRPGSRDNRPIVGWSAIPGVFYATGHFRHGILVAAATAREVAAVLTGEETTPDNDPFSPLRFIRTSAS
jgi:glycine oxidase